MKSSTAIILLSLLLMGCSSEVQMEKFTFDFPDSIKALGHKGSGTHGEFGNTFRDNSIDGIINAIEQLDGVEVDIQMSADSTLWLFHDHVILNCSGVLENIASLSDTTIVTYGRCNYEGQISPLYTLSDTLRKLSFSGKIISLDLKVLQNPMSIDRFGGEEELAVFVAEKLNTFITELNAFEVFVEVPYSSQVDIMESITGRTTFLIHNSFEYLRQPLRMNHSAPIHHFYTDVPELFENYGQQSLVWVVNSADEMMNAIRLRPTAIQTDNISMVHFFRSLPTRGIISNTIRIPPPKETTDFVMITEVMAPLQEDVLFELELDMQQMEGVQVVFSSVDAQGNATKWEALPISKNRLHFFQGAKEHSALKTASYKLYLWQPDGEQIHLTNALVFNEITLTKVN